MIGRVLLAALLAGIAAGLFMGVIQHWRLTPLIVAAETYEVAEHGHDAAAAEWAPEQGFERTAFTTLTAVVTGAAFAAILAGISLLAGIPITRGNGILWGLCGFLAVSLAPAAGLPPELPGMPAGDLALRQVWWAGTIVATALAIYLIVTGPRSWKLPAAIALLALPHVIGAPGAVAHQTAVPAGLAAAFAANAIAASAAFWCLIGLFLGLAFEKITGDMHPT